MEEHEEEASSVNEAEIFVCIFPHLREFILLDVRDMEKPQSRVVAVEELLTPRYYEEVEREFSRMLRSGESPFLNLLQLPNRLEAHLRRKGMRALSQFVPGGDENQRLSVFLCDGPILAMSDEDISGMMETFFQGGPPASFVQEYGATFKHLLEQEKASIRAREQEELRRAVEGRSSQFYTLWQNRSGPQAN